MLRWQKDKDLAWVITFTSFLVFLLSAVLCSFFDFAPRALPQAVLLANPSLNRAFLRVLANLVRYLALGSIGLGIYGIIFWPHGRG